MPAVNFNLYDSFREGNFDGNEINFEVPGGNGVTAAIVTSVYTPDQNLHDFWNDVSTNEVSGTGYVAGGNVLANGIVSKDGAGLVTVDLDDPAAWTQDAAGFANGRRVVIYADSGTGATSRLIGYSDAFTADRGNVNGPFSVTLGIAGLLTSAR